MFKKTIAVYTENHMKHIHRPTLYGKSAEILNIKAGGAYSYHCSADTAYYQSAVVLKSAR
jgi:hypothetical protein